jgi:hypothetical protein
LARNRRCSPTIEILGATIEILGAIVELLGATIEILGSTIEILGATIEILGATIEIVGTMLEKACLKTRETFFPRICTLFCEAKRGSVDPLKNCTFELNYLV